VGLAWVVGVGCVEGVPQQDGRQADRAGIPLRHAGPPRLWPFPLLGEGVVVGPWPAVGLGMACCSGAHIIDHIIIIAIF